MLCIAKNSMENLLKPCISLCQTDTTAHKLKRDGQWGGGRGQKVMEQKDWAPSKEDAGKR